MALVLHQGGAGEEIELLDALVRQIAVHRLEQREMFPERDGNLGVAQGREEVKQHEAENARTGRPGQGCPRTGHARRNGR